MYGLKESLDLNFLINSEITQVALGKHDVQISFGERVKICAQCKMTFERSTGAVDIDGEDGQSAGDLSELLGEIVSAIKIPNGKELVLHFKSGNLLRIFDSSERYESFVVWNNGVFTAV